MDIDGVKVKVEALTNPDFNMVDFAFNIEGNEDLEKMNALNFEIYNMSSYVAGPVFKNDFITSHTEFTYDDYGDAPVEIAERLGIKKDEWDKVHNFRILRACVLSPYLMNNKDDEHYWKTYSESIKEKLRIIIPKLK